MQSEEEMVAQDATSLVTVDRRDLFDAVRLAIKNAMVDQGSREDGAELFADATDRTNECLSDIFSTFDNIQSLTCVKIPMRHEGYFTVGNKYRVHRVDTSDTALPLLMSCDENITLWCESSAFSQEAAQGESK